MVKKGKLLLALDAHKGRDYEAERKRKQTKSAEKRKKQKSNFSKRDESGDEETNGQKPEQLKSILRSKRGKNGLKQPDVTLESDTDSSEENDEPGQQLEAEHNESLIPQPAEAIDASASEAEQESDVPVSDLENEDMEDVVPHQRLTINNIPALTASRKRITVAKPTMPFHYHNSLVSTLPPSESVIPDPDDDLTRELEFYRIAREGVVTARSLLKKEKIPFTRPSDYFAEMVKNDEHMGRVKKKLYDEAAGKKATEEARKLRDAKKFGKAVQVAKEQERAKEKRATLDNIKNLKRKRQGQTPTATHEGDDLFQEIAVESNDSRSRNRDRSSFSTSNPNNKRQKRDSKFGFGGKKRFNKSGDAMSSADMSGFSNKAMKGRAVGKKRPTTKRLGKSKRAAARS